jgi:membrane dipeptidase
MGVLSSAVDRLLHTAAPDRAPPPSPDALALHAATPVVDLVVGTALFRATLIGPARGGHVDLPRLRAGGVDVIGLTIATRFPDLRGTLSRFHFRSLGATRAALASNMALAEWLIERIHRWCAASAGQLRLLTSRADLQPCLGRDGPIGVFVGVQGAHVLDGRLDGLERLRSLGVRMFAPAHVMDNRYVSSGTGRLRGGLTTAGIDLIGELERLALLVDLAHMSTAGIDHALDIVGRPPVLSHTGLTARARAGSRWRRYSPATRNVPDWVVQEVAAAGGVTGIVLASRLLGGDTPADAAVTFKRAVELGGARGVAIGSDMDGGLRMVIDAAGLPRLTGELLASGLEPTVVRGILGGNALRLLNTALPAVADSTIEAT